MTAIDNTSNFDPISVEVWRHIFSAVAEEMGGTLERTSYSPNIKERRDYSCALFDCKGELIAQAAHIPVHLGAMPVMMEALFSSIKWQKGDVWICNDLKHGGTHLPDLTVIEPIYCSGDSTPTGFAANRAHHADIGGMSPGSLPLSTEIFQEGLIISPVRLVNGGRLNADILQLICSNSRTPEERRGDLLAQLSANRVGVSSYLELIQNYGIDTIQERIDQSKTYSSKLIKTALKSIEGVYLFRDAVESDGKGNEEIPICLTLTIKDGAASFDFSGTSDQVSGSLNCSEAVTKSACYYAIRCLVREDIPMNSHTFRNISVFAPKGSLVNCDSRCAVAAGNVETSQRIVDVCLGALAQARPELIPAASQGTMNNFLVGGFDPLRNQPFSYYETICGGAGAAPGNDGASATQVHMTNTRNTPVEIFEMHYPLQVMEYSIRPKQCNGKWSGGSGVVRRVKLLTDCQVTVISERRRTSPYGLNGGGNGTKGKNTVTIAGLEEELPAKVSRRFPKGSVITIKTPGGGGHGA